MEASSTPRETQTDEVQHTATAAAPHQVQAGNPHLAGRPKPKSLPVAATCRKWKAVAQAANKGGPAGAESSASTLSAGTIPPKRATDPGYTPEEVGPPPKKRKPDYREVVVISLLPRQSHQKGHWGGMETYSKRTDSAHWYVSLPFWVPWTSVQSVWFGSGCF